MKLKCIAFLTIASLFLVSCGHNVITDYEVIGLDLSIPIGGYPFGIRIGMVKVNANMIRGNATYSANSNSGTEVGTGAVQKSSVIQFSSNAQINEGNVEKIMTSEDVSDEVKETFIAEYLGEQKAPTVLAVTSKTPTAVTVVGDDPEIHQNIELEKQESILSFLSAKNWISGIFTGIGGFFVTTKIGKMILLILEIIAGIIVILFVIDIFKKLFRLIKTTLENRKKKKLEEQEPKENEMTVITETEETENNDSTQETEIISEETEINTEITEEQEKITIEESKEETTEETKVTTETVEEQQQEKEEKVEPEKTVEEQPKTE